MTKEIAYKGNKYTRNLLDKTYRVKAGTQAYCIGDISMNPQPDSNHPIDGDMKITVNAIWAMNSYHTFLHQDGFWSTAAWFELSDLTPIGGVLRSLLYQALRPLFLIERWSFKWLK